MSEVSLIDGHIDTGISDEEIINLWGRVNTKSANFEKKFELHMSGAYTIKTAEFINRQRAEIEFLRASKGLDKAESNELKAELELKKAEIEKLNIELKAMRGAANSYKAEVERLKKENEILSENADTAFQDGLNEAQDLYANQIRCEVKSEAIKEFAERLKNENWYDSNYAEWLVSVSDIDNLVKEMTESK